VVDLTNVPEAFRRGLSVNLVYKSTKKPSSEVTNVALSNMQEFAAVEFDLEEYESNIDDLVVEVYASRPKMFALWGGRATPIYRQSLLAEEADNVLLHNEPGDEQQGDAEDKLIEGSVAFYNSLPQKYSWYSQLSTPLKFHNNVKMSLHHPYAPATLDIQDLMSGKFSFEARDYGDKTLIFLKVNSEDRSNDYLLVNDPQWLYVSESNEIIHPSLLTHALMAKYKLGTNRRPVYLILLMPSSYRNE
jgi:hypothetical protein